LLGNTTQGDAGFLGLDDAGRLAADQQQVITGTGGQRELANGDAFAGIAIEIVPVLDEPSGRPQQLVNSRARVVRG
jgi:hypothetical protein